MTAKNDEFRISENIITSKQITFITCTAFLVSSLYQSGYWLPFGVNIFQYLSVQDILVRSIIPVIVTSGVLFGAFAAHMDSKKKKEKEHKEHPDLERQRIFDQKIKTILLIIFSTIAPAFFGIWLILKNDYSGLLILSVCASTLVSMIMARNGWSHYIQTKTKLPFIAIVAVLGMTFGALGSGLANAYNITKGDKGARVEVQSDYFNTSSAKFIGEAGGIVFLWDKTKNHVIQIKRSDIKKLIIHKK